MNDHRHEDDEIIATIMPSLARFWGALIIILGFGCLLLWIAATGAAGTLAGTVVFLCFSAFSFYAAHRLHKIKGVSIILTQKGLFDTSGRMLCAVEQIDAIDRSFFALKPSNGFVVRLKEPLARAWVPGLWWRLGRRVGVGGITSVSQAKSTADTISLLLKGGPEVLEGLHNPFAR